MPDKVLEALAAKFTFSEQERVDETHRAVRFCTSWATTQENVALLCKEIQEIYKKFIETQKVGLL